MSGVAGCAYLLRAKWRGCLPKGRIPTGAVELLASTMSSNVDRLRSRVQGRCFWPCMAERPSCQCENAFEVVTVACRIVCSVLTRHV